MHYPVMLRVLKRDCKINQINFITNIFFVFLYSNLINMNNRTVFLILILFFAQLEIFGQTADFEFDNESAMYCIHDTTKFINNSSDYVSLLWQFGDGYDTYAENPKHIYQSSGTYTVRLTVFDAGGNSDYIEKSLIINELPELYLSPSGDTTIVGGEALTITASGNYDNILWSTDDTENEITVIKGGLYYADVSVDATGCTNSDTLRVISENTDETDGFELQTLNNILTPNNDGVNDYLFVKGLAQFETACEIYIYDVSGKLVYSELDYKNNWGGTSANNTQLESGTYYYILKTKNKIGGTGFIDIIF